jgi:hypothetical protein
MEESMMYINEDLTHGKGLQISNFGIEFLPKLDT